jgi:hypothetical protein
LGTTILAAASGLGGELPLIFDKPFLGCFVGYAGARDFEFAIGGGGTSELFFRKDRKTRLQTGGTTLKIYYVLEEKLDGKKWTNRFMSEDGFATSFKETATPELGKPVTFTATYTGDTKVEITHIFTKSSVEISTRVVEKTTKNEVRVGVKVVAGDLYRHIKEEITKREARTKIKKGRIEVWPVGSKRSKRIDLSDLELKLPEEFPKGASKFSLESDRIADHEYSLTTADPALGNITFKQRNELFHGFSLYWWPDPAKVKEKDARLVIEVD